MRKTVSVCGAAAATLMIAGSASAHHSFAMFDRDTQIELTGEVKEFQWTNPHTWTQILVEEEDGTITEWSIEGGSPNGLTRQGWKRNSLKSGDKVIMTINPLHNGRPGGSFVRAVMEDGTVLGRQLPAPGETTGD